MCTYTAICFNVIKNKTPHFFQILVNFPSKSEMHSVSRYDRNHSTLVHNYPHSHIQAMFPSCLQTGVSWPVIHAFTFEVPDSAGVEATSHRYGIAPLNKSTCNTKHPKTQGQIIKLWAVKLLLVYLYHMNKFFILSLDVTHLLWQMKIFDIKRDNSDKAHQFAATWPPSYPLDPLKQLTC